ncbi:MAG: hypothetical protein HND48_23795 [Chloroflexi bacterium]|nr:hypothetical protein [Chloroflexota bacterium]
MRRCATSRCCPKRFTATSLRKATADDLIIYDPAPFNARNGGGEPEKVEIARFAFPRQPIGDYLCISDYYAPVDSGQVDVVTLQVVTVGAAARAKFDVSWKPPISSARRTSSTGCRYRRPRRPRIT